MGCVSIDDAPTFSTGNLLIEESEHKAFDDALERFLENLSADERIRYSPCSSADELLKGLQKLDVISKKSQMRISGRLTIGIKKFNDCLQPYFEVVSIFIQSNPEYPAIVWGALRLVLQLASNFATFFEKVIAVLEHLIDEFPQYASIAHLCKNRHSHRMKSHLENIYIDLFEFFQSVARIFTNPIGKFRKTPAIIGDLMWKPFDVRFGDIMGRMRHHRDLISSELNIITAQAANNAEAVAAEERSLAAKERSQASASRKRINEWSSRLEEGQNEAQHKRIQTWLSPPCFAERLQSAQDLREDGTNNWIFRNENFEKWQRSTLLPPNFSSTQKKTGQNVLWLHGPPGCGKTVLASSIVKELQDYRTSSGEATTIGYFFFTSDNPALSLASAAYSSILAQLLHIRSQDSAFINKFVFAMSKATDGHDKATSLEVADLLQICIQGLDDVYLVMDGIDECNDNLFLLRNLHLLAMHSNVKVLLLSRVNVTSLNRLIPKSCQLAINRSSTGGDIRMYLTTQVDLMIDEELIPQTADLEDLVDHLVKGADGMFLWARLMSTYLNSPALTPAMRMRTINTVILPEGLESMYNRILGLIAQGGRTEQDLAQRIIMWLIHAIRPLTFIELHEALTVQDGISDSKYSNRFTNLQETISLVCGGLVEASALNWHGDTNVRFIHLSVREYFATLPSYTNSLLPSCHLAHSTLARFCLQNLIARSPEEKWSAERGAPVNSFNDYAAYHWMDHLAEISVHLSNLGVTNIPDFEEMLDQIVPTLDKFLETPMAISLWLDAYYSLTSRPMSALTYQHPRCEQLQRFITLTSCSPYPIKLSNQFRELCEKLHAFALDMEALIESWGQNLLQSPSTIWDEVPAFVKSPFLAGSTATIVTSLASNGLESPESSSKALCTISSTASNGKWNGVLSIWPSRTYEEQWKNLRPESPYSILLPLCTEWTARYQMWSNEQHPVCKFDIRIPLQEYEVSLQMRQSFRQESTNDWKTSFVLAISEDALSFVILRTVYRLRPATVNKLASLESAIIPMDLLPASSARWSEDLKLFNPPQLGIAHLPPGLHFLHHDWYKYHWYFSPDGHYLFFSDSFGAPTVTQLAVFEFLDLDSLTIKLIGHRSFHTLFGRKYALVEKIAFHPTCSLIIYWNNNSLNLWHFRRQNSKVTVFGHWRSENQHIAATSHGYVEPPKAITISACGKYVVVVHGNASTVVPIPTPELNLPENILVEGPTTTAIPKLHNEQPVAQIGKMDVSSFNLRPGDVLKDLQVSIGRDGHSHRVLSVDSDDTVVVRTTNDSHMALQVNMVKLPQCRDESLTPSLIMPNGCADAIRIVMNKRPMHAYTMNTTPNEKAPFIVDRDPRSMQPFMNLTSSSLQRPIETAEASKSATPIPLRTAPSANQIIGLRDGEGNQAFNAVNIFDAIRPGQESPSKRLKFS